MKRYRKKELLEIVETLQKANDTIGQNLKKAVQDETVALLTQSQELAITLGNIVETEGDQGKQIIPVLEAFCETIYQMVTTLSDEIYCRKLLKKAQKQIYLIKKQIQFEFPEDRKEILFLPYKASMWDSLESVWMAAAADEDCDTYVMPIPYYDKNADGSLGQLHYEGNEYPEYVPITALKEYNIAEHRPDVIYIHNPYDDTNLVTSVHPMFYASKLKEYTDMLVYIPYFVAIHDAVEEHFCVLPGTIYADRVIVQSEKVRQIYIEQFHKFERQNSCEGKFGKAEEKFLALGSPKYDKAVTAKIEDFTIPDHWKKLIWKEDGNRKKVVLYNTSIECMLKNPGKMIWKIQDVLKKFKEEKDIVLLWRPHPLLKPTLQAMCGEAFQCFMTIEADYISGGWGIYDTSAELYRAITLADAYYGDWSSVVEIYQKTGKPVMIQDVEIAEC